MPCLHASTGREGERARGDGFGGIPPVGFRDVRGSFVRGVDFGNLHVSMIGGTEAFRQGVFTWLLHSPPWQETSCHGGGIVTSAC